MSYQWPLAAKELFAERYPQMINTGLPVPDVDAVRAAITDMWADEPGGWVHEWSALAARYAAAGSHDLSALAYGWARFPTLADEAKRGALARQTEQYLLAAPGFAVPFRRDVLNLPYRGGLTQVPVHVFTPPAAAGKGPVLLVSGGVDSWKMDVHGLLVTLCSHAGLPVVAFDIPGTGDSQVPMSPDGAEIVRGLIGHARTLGNGIVVHVGISMGGHYSARSGLAAEADAAIVLGGPIEAAFADGRLPRFGMDDIVGNALGFDRQPSRDDLFAALAGFSLRPLLDQENQAPMLVVNGADDVHVPQEDTLVFEGRRDTEVHLLPDTGHCAITKLPEVLQIISEWLPRTLATLQADPGTAEGAE
ncbi:alpha/beta hydrolase [Streptomyces sp. NBC_00243]|uniref:alpha/beta fold hydrolase n=1 Tax=Streptomyces sp. NBC_00243 TaxID=2975688 RepID=UPI002DDB2537|nr:alpha/beta hydrolase [Streptomyces sp. NBC_00243]WRZ25471.1 alpha/beta hydrolase [Streptomyces sp. NBC_00243]